LIEINLLKLINLIFNDQHRVLKISGAITVIVLLSLPNIWLKPRFAPNIKNIAANIEEYYGKDRAFFLVKVYEVEPDGIWVNAKTERQGILKVKGDFSDVIPGTMITIMTHIDKNGGITLKDYHIHKFRGAKHLLSLLALIPVAVIFMRSLKFDMKRLIFTWREGV